MPETIPSNIFYDLLDSQWNASNVPKPSIYRREEIPQEVVDIDGTMGVGSDVLLVYLDIVGVAEKYRGNWTYKDMKATVSIDILVGYSPLSYDVAHQRLYDLVAEIRRISYANRHNVSPYHLCRYIGFSPTMEEKYGVWSGKCRVSIESEGVEAP